MSVVPTIVGILNITPDSFSDGGESFTEKDALARAKSLIADGAEVIDIGGDSTRPGSICVGPEEEWRRIEPVLKVLGRDFPVSVDTHHSDVADKALRTGVKIINDVTSGQDPEMFHVLRGASAKIVLMHSRCKAPHAFGPNISGDLIEQIKRFLGGRIELAIQAGLRADQIILDPGIGGFLSSDPHASWRLLELAATIPFHDFPLYFGVSRKGFLRAENERTPKERDGISSVIGVFLSKVIDSRRKLFLRTHNPKLQRLLLN